jgi:hypothetical protein
VKTDYTIS